MRFRRQSTPLHCIRSPSTGRGTFFTQATPTKFATTQRPTTTTDNFTTVLTLVHFITILTIKPITSITDPNFMIGLIFMTPVTIATNEGMTAITRNLNSGSIRGSGGWWCGTVETCSNDWVFVFTVVI